MGSLQATEMVRLLGNLDTALTWHLRHNHYPPVPASLMSACKSAIDAYADDDTEQLIPLPAYMRWKGNDSAPASAIIDGFHLEAFLQGD